MVYSILLFLLEHNLLLFQHHSILFGIDHMLNLNNWIILLVILLSLQYLICFMIVFPSYQVHGCVAASALGEVACLTSFVDACIGVVDIAIWIFGAVAANQRCAVFKHIPRCTGFCVCPQGRYFDGAQIFAAEEHTARIYNFCGYEADFALFC